MSQTRIRSVRLPQGRKKQDNSAYDRHIDFQPGMEGLVNIVAGLQKDVKRINEAITLAGAQQYAAKHGRNWSAHEEDITGPDGRPDGIKEVFVTDGSGNVKVINGYGLSKTTYPQRKLYRTVYPTRDERKENPMNKFLHEFKELKDTIDPQNGPSYEKALDSYPNLNEQNGPQFIGLRPTIKPREWFKQNIFAPRYAEAAGEMDGLPPMVKAQIFNKALAESYNTAIRDEVLNNNHIDPRTSKKSKIDKLMKQPSFVQDAFNVLQHTISNEEDLQAVQALIDDTIGEVIEKVRPQQ